MKNKPIKRSEYIVKLSRDHHASLLFCWKIRQAKRLEIAPSRVKPYVAYFSADHMRPHFDEEEQILFPPAINDPLVKQAFTEHQDIYRLVDQIALAEDKELQPLLDEIAETVDKHVRFEERVLFPHLEKIIPEVELKKISDQLDHEPEKDTYADEFWVKPR